MHLNKLFRYILSNIKNLFFVRDISTIICYATIFVVFANIDICYSQKIQSNEIDACINIEHSRKCQACLRDFASKLYNAIELDTSLSGLDSVINFVSICSGMKQNDIDKDFKNYLQNNEIDIGNVSDLYDKYNPFAFLNKKISAIHSNNNAINIIMFDEMFFCRFSYLSNDAVNKIMRWIQAWSEKYKNSIFIINNVFCEDVSSDDYLSDEGYRNILTDYVNRLDYKWRMRDISTRIDVESVKSQINDVVSKHGQRKNLKYIKNQSEIVHDGKVLIKKLKGSYCLEGGDIFKQNYDNISTCNEQDFYMYAFGDGYSNKLEDTNVSNLLMKSFYCDLCLDVHVGIGSRVNFYQGEDQYKNSVNNELGLYVLCSNVICIMRDKCLSNLPRYHIPILHIDKTYGDDVNLQYQQSDYLRMSRDFSVKPKIQNLTRSDQKNITSIKVNRYNFGNYVECIEDILVANKNADVEQLQTIQNVIELSNNIRKRSNIMRKSKSLRWYVFGAVKAIGGLARKLLRWQFSVNRAVQQELLNADRYIYIDNPEPTLRAEYDSLKPMDFLKIDDRGVKDFFKTIMTTYNFIQIPE